MTLLPHQITGFGEGRRVLLVEDDEPVRELIASYLLREGFEVVESPDAKEAVRKLRSEFDVVITDLGLPGPNGTELIRTTRSRWPDTRIVVITGLKGSRITTEALSAGADRYLYKPFGMSELRSRMMDVLAARERRYRRLDDATEGDGYGPGSSASVREGVLSLARGAELRDPYLRGHAERVWAFARELAGAIDPEDEELPRSSLELGCRLHDVGRLRVPQAILQKEGALDDDEHERLRKHPSIGRRMLEPVLDDPLALEVVTWHHERWDGSGYPDGLSGEAIPLAARVVSLADALDAMSSPRPHRTALGWSEAVSCIRKSAGTQFDPAVVDALEVRLDVLAALYAAREASD